MQQVTFTLDQGSERPRAAQYVRMSKEHQKYSTQNQADAVAAFAACRGLTVVRTYRDEGRSGLRLAGREALQDLINDVRTGRADFECILVYDVSRWGRFQDADESAYYEFVCKQAGIKVLYCAEQFENDGSLSSTILKNLKRAMAGEYSRDLSSKTFIGQSRLATLGFWQGGLAGIGLRRQLLDERRTPKALLEYGQQKSLQTDRVILVPGPSSEVQIVRRIFDALVLEQKTLTDIAKDLNADKIPNAVGSRWNRQTVRRLLSNEKYIGNNIFNRVSFKLSQKRIVNPPQMWVRGEEAFQPIIDRDLFANAQKIIAERRERLTDQEMLDRLSALWRKHGYLSRSIIAAASNVPFYSTYTEHFGSLLAAYKLIGFKPKHRFQFVEIEAHLNATFTSVLKEIVSNVERLGGSMECDKRTRALKINNKLAVSIGIAWCAQTRKGQEWRVHFARSPISRLSLVIRMDELNRGIHDYFLLPTSELVQPKALKVLLPNPAFIESYRYDALDTFCWMCAHDELGGSA